MCSARPDVEAAARLMRAQGEAVAALCEPLPGEIAARTPPAGGWSVAFVVSHLLDEEREDFRVRLGATLADPDRAWPPIDPEGWGERRDYASRDHRETLAAFVAERAASAAWIRKLADSPWDAVHAHPSLGELSARDLLAAWLDHDRVHLRQILRILHDLGESVVPGGRPDYAGGAW